ncbi:hypothetical protein LAUMK142_00086 [Mycobacterium pseudokansasii]|uniref:Uncharacterized protein n=1 Tax=Mycobacterium pseudokansasii TaxID=2341080 RepID=A0A498QKL2_9MYCO|nr:hypothetical protein LAUMK142_00086 [Mycobacterium pseudokansasii]
MTRRDFEFNRRSSTFSRGARNLTRATDAGGPHIGHAVSYSRHGKGCRWTGKAPWPVVQDWRFLHGGTILLA